MRRIYLTESQFNKMFTMREGVNYTPTSKDSFNVSINHDTSDIANANVDTRLFGNKYDMLYGNNTRNGCYQPLVDKRNSRKQIEQAYTNLINWVENGRQGYLDLPQQVSRTTSTIKGWINDGYSDEELLLKARKALSKKDLDNEITFNKYDKVVNSFSDKIARYDTFIVPGTNVKCISLFSMDDFNFSDAIKNGSLRQNDTTDRLLRNAGLGGDRIKDGTSYKPMSVKYDGDVNPNISSNFSLNNVQDGHYSDQYGYEGEDVGNGKKTSIAAFLDKSIAYAAYALKQESYSPDFIVSCPSSSRFNEFYCTRLSSKLGIPYVKDFFKRDVVNVYVGDKDVEELAKRGIPEEDIFKFKETVKGMAFREIGYIVSDPIRKYIESHQEQLTQVPRQKSSREKMSINEITDAIFQYSFDFIANNYEVDELDKRVIDSFLKEGKKPYVRTKYDSTYVFTYVQKVLGMTSRDKEYHNALNETFKLLKQYNQVMETGYKPSAMTKRPKMVQIAKRFRPYMQNVYVVSDKELSNTGSLLSRYQLGNFLVFDEDTNSGATLKFVVNALTSKLWGNHDDSIMCLVNAYSEKSM